MKGYPGGKCKVKVTEGMGRNVFSATQAAVDGLDFHLSRNRIDGSLQARMASLTGPSFWLSEERKGGLLYFDVEITNQGPALGATATLEWYLAKNIEPQLHGEKKSVLWHDRLGHESIKAFDLWLKVDTLELRLPN